MKYLFVPACALLLVLSLACGARAESYTGTWSVQGTSDSQTVHLRTEYRRSEASGDEEWIETNDVPIAQLHGLRAADFASSGEHKQFDIVRDAGTLRAGGWFANGSGSGSWTFVPSAAFANALAQRGVSRPSDKEELQLAMSGFQLATLDTLLREGFKRPTPGDLVSMTEHGVNDAYVEAMKNVPLRPKSIASLVRMRDHGVEPRFAAQALAYNPALTSDDLVRMRDHGVTIGFIDRMRSHGYARLSADDLIRLRDHGF